MRQNSRAALVLIAVLAGGCILPRASVSPYGKSATVYSARGGAATGELIAANAENIWLLRNGSLDVFGTSSILTVDVERHRFDGMKTFKWMTLTGVATGAALTLSCIRFRSHDGGNAGGCGGVLLGTTGVFAGIGSLLAISNDHSSMYHLVPNDVNQLRAFARFPQGLPDSLRARLFYSKR